MKQTLTLKMGQSLTMTPQLQQAIRLLQLSALDLQQEIQDTLYENPMLELIEASQNEETGDHISIEDQEAAAELDPSALAAQDAERVIGAETDVPDVHAELAKPLGEEMPVDSSWEDVYSNSGSLPTSDSDYDPMLNRSEDLTLIDHLLWQLNLTPMADSDRLIARCLIDAIDPSGLLTQSTEEIWHSLIDPTMDIEDQISHEDVDAVLLRVQTFDPIGVAARSVQECLLLQLAQLDPDTRWLPEARLLINHYTDLLAAKDFGTLQRKTKLSEPELINVMALLRTLNPRPGSIIERGSNDYIVPDVVVRQFEGRWLVELNSDAAPNIRINPFYENLAKQTTNTNDRTYMRNNLQDARWFLKSLQTRHDTLLRVASKIVEVQRGFLEYGPQAMKPLILAEIAEAVELHESTISRVTNHKYMATPRGVFELKYFFSSHVGTTSGGEVSSIAIRALIQQLTAQENPKKPLSDSKIAAILKEQKINVARRTVAKYRESLAIPSSSERKQRI